MHACVCYSGINLKYFNSVELLFTSDIQTKTSYISNWAKDTVLCALMWTQVKI